MKRLDGIRATGTQKLATTASNGDTVSITLYFNPAVQVWFFDIEWKNFTLLGKRLFSNPNILSQYEKIIPFGLAAITEGGGEPFLVNDFSSGRVNMYLLSPEEVIQVQDFYVEQGDLIELTDSTFTFLITPDNKFLTDELDNKLIIPNG